MINILLPSVLGSQRMLRYAVQLLIFINDQHPYTFSRRADLLLHEVNDHHEIVAREEETHPKPLQPTSYQAYVIGKKVHFQGSDMYGPPV
jgi:hypothetical protein